MDAEGWADLLPWLVFVVVERKTGLGLGWAGGCATLVSALLAGVAYWRGRRAPVARLGVPLFACLCLADFVVPSLSGQFADARAVSMLVLAAVALGSLPFTPLSTAYTVAHVVRTMRDGTAFRRVNVELTTAWGLGSVLIAMAYAASDIEPSAVALTFLNWVVPLALAALTLLWSARRWQRFRLRCDVEASFDRTGDRGTRELGSWVDAPDAWADARDAVVHRMPSAGRRNA